MRDVEALELLHALRAPATWLQVGLRRPELLTIPRCGAVGVDPAPRIAAGGNAGKPWLKLYALGCEAFFATEDPQRVLDGLPLDFVTIEGEGLPELAAAIDGVAGWAHGETWAALFAADDEPDDLRRLALLLGEQRPGWRPSLVAAEPAPFLFLAGLPAMENESAFALPGDDAAWDRLEQRLAEIRAIAVQQAVPGEAVAPMAVAARLEPGGWFPGPGDGAVLIPGWGDIGANPRITFEPGIRGAFRVALALDAGGMEVLRLRCRSAGPVGTRDRDVYLDVQRPGALYHELARVALATPAAAGLFRLELEGPLRRGESLHEVALAPVSATFQEVPATRGMALRLHELSAEQVAHVPEGPAHVPVRMPEKALRSSQRGRRDAVVCAWFSRDLDDPVGEHYLGLLRYHHAGAKVFLGMNHGTAPGWEERFRQSGLDVEIRWAPPGTGDYWDASGFLTALAEFRDAEECFDLVWFVHTKGASTASYTDYQVDRYMHERDFWARGEEIARFFRDPKIGLFTAHYNPTPPYPFAGATEGWARELTSLQRVYRDRFAPLGLCAFETFFVLRGEIVRRFCQRVAADFFQTDPGDYGLNKWFFEMAFPSIASMQGYEPYIERDVPGRGDPQSGVILARDRKQNHRLAQAELERWRADPYAFQPRILPWDYPAWNQMRGLVGPLR